MKLVKERFHPCCGFYLQGVVRWLPILETMLMLVACALVSAGMAKKWSEMKYDQMHNPTNYYIRLILWSGYILHVVATIVLAYILFRGCRYRKPVLLRVWVVCTVISVTYTMSIMITNIIKFTKFSPNYFAMVSAYATLKFYLCYVIHYYMKDLETDIEMSSAQRLLNICELEAFENGLVPPFEIQDLDLKTKNLVDRIQYQRYKREDFEIDLENLKFEMGSPLGQGEYGTVYKAVLTSGNGGLERTVAVKTVSAENMDVVCFKALLTELKVMTYMGHHPNVINLIGASTSEIVRRSLYIVVEFCALGNLHSFLRGYRGLFVNQVRNGQLLPPNFENECETAIECEKTDSISTRDLIRFSYEIALGMEYLVSKKVNHGDLAARNVLLTDKREAKITDFGLARQLYNYSVYVKKQNGPLPWRSLALESMTDMSYSAMSDVWAYGITSWEIFTLAEVPYAGYNFGLQFVQNLKDGLRPNYPPFATTEIWKLMERCWQKEPKSRPSFTEIVLLLSSSFHTTK